MTEIAKMSGATAAEIEEIQASAIHALRAENDRLRARNERLHKALESLANDVLAMRTTLNAVARKE